MSGRGPARVGVRRLPEARDLPMPSRATEHASGFDLRARVDGAVRLAPGERCCVPTGIELAIPPGYEGQVRPRSGLARDRGITLLNAPGTIDADYRGEVAVVVVNLGEAAVTLERGDRVAQLVIQRLPEVVLEESEALPATGRGAGGFGHTGTR